MTEKLDANSEFEKKLRLLLPVFYWTIVAIASGALLGWIFDINFLKNIAPGYLSMRPNIAVGLFFIGQAIISANKDVARVL